MRCQGFSLPGVSGAEWGGAGQDVVGQGGAGWGGARCGAVWGG